MKTNFKQAAAIFFSPETLIPFLVGAVFLSVLGNAVTNFIFGLVGITPVTSLLVAMGAVLIFSASVVLFGRGLTKLRSPGFKLKKMPPIAHRGLILLVSRLEPCQKAIEYHSKDNVLQYCWLICSTESSKVAKKLEDFYPTINFFKPLVINDIHDPYRFHKEVKEIYENLPEGLDAEEVISDYTGMTAHGSVGMVLACLSRGYELQYTPAEYDESGKVIGSLDPIEIVLKAKNNSKKRADFTQQNPRKK